MEIVASVLKVMRNIGPYYAVLGQEIEGGDEAAEDLCEMVPAQTHSSDRSGQRKERELELIEDNYNNNIEDFGTS
jgi:hypothetical protein